MRPTARALFAAVLVADVEDGRTTVDELIESGAATRRQAITLLRDLDEAGCGEFKVGRKGHPSRLEWSGDPRELARQIIDEMDGRDDAEHDSRSESEPSPPEADQPDRALPPAAAIALDLSFAQPELPVAANEPHAAPAPTSTGHTRAAELDAAGDDEIEHTYVLRPSRRVSVTLPADLTRREAEVLADWLRNLSFER
ncbi:hypothetical protein DB30_07550 [Enhygromyxa salina]|uniref:Uncharacterized protein n=1 Tax=Enhygromyxa salina TaxID=215803 RepID=A0A0C1Z7W9_9BACT|nr:hypothetical protein [Enhygromyxa salina]KIG13704.1 hypothetical protein DB30_07550 [Enhygromyxa salina]